MDYLQYCNGVIANRIMSWGFKPCYKWITFNTLSQILLLIDLQKGFKPCYKWITFNTERTFTEIGVKIQF